MSFSVCRVLSLQLRDVSQASVIHLKYKFLKFKNWSQGKTHENIVNVLDKKDTETSLHSKMHLLRNTHRKKILSLLLNIIYYNNIHLTCIYATIAHTHLSSHVNSKKMSVVFCNYNGITWTTFLDQNTDSHMVLVFQVTTQWEHPSSTSAQPLTSR